MHRGPRCGRVAHQTTLNNVNMRTKLIVFVVRGLFLMKRWAFLARWPFSGAWKNAARRMFDLSKEIIEADIRGKGMTLGVDDGMAHAWRGREQTHHGQP